MFCPNCGKEILDNSVYCNKCGTKVNNTDILSIDDKDEVIVSERIIEAKKLNFHKLKIKKVAIGLILLIIMLVAGFGGYKYVQAKNFNNLVKTANQKLDTGNYDESIQLYDKALAYKNDGNVQKELATAKNYKQDQDIYNDGLRLMSDKRYNDAIQKFNAITKNTLPMYNNAQKKLEECKKDIIASDIQLANNSIKNGDYDTASKYVNEILKSDSNNNDAEQLRATILQLQNKQKQEDEDKEESNEIIIKYSIDNNGYIIDTNYPNGSNIQVKVGQTINLVGKISSSSSQRVLFDGTIMQSVSPTVVKTIAVGGGDINIIPNGYDWDKSYKYHIIVNN